MKEKEINNCECEDKEKCNENCNCGCEENPLIIEMEDIDGEKVKVEVVGTFDDQGKSYAIVNDLDNTDNSYIFEVQTKDDNDILVSIDDEKEFDRLCKVVEELTK